MVARIGIPGFPGHAWVRRASVAGCRGWVAERQAEGVVRDWAYFSERCAAQERNRSGMCYYPRPLQESSETGDNWDCEAALREAR